MPSEELRRRLEALNRQPLENLPPLTPDPSPKHGRGAGSEGLEPRAASARRRQARQNGTARARLAEGLFADGFVSLESCLPGAVRAAPGNCLYYHVERRLTDHAPWAASLGAELCAALDGELLRAHLRRTTGVPPDQIVFLDLETLGLCAAPLFLAGTLRLASGGAVRCSQLLARDGGEEPGVVAAFAETLRAAKLLVTFNGIGFDIPFLKDRAAAHGIALPHLPKHLDVLVEARHRYRRLLPNCRLQTLERHLCGRTRTGDVPGAEIPAVYREFVRTGNAAGLAVILQHNLLDLATTAELLAKMWKG
jgi:uncharacterized protein YprB with RNaseH-like and TPR domain